MSTTSLRQKIALILFGILITIFALELVLRLGGFLFHARQEMGNKASFATDEIRILCIGESTTALGNDNSYPAQLEDFLNQRSGSKKFKVINKGEISKTSFDLLNHLDASLKKYHPQIVVGMIGINDTKDTPGFAAGNKAEAFWSQFRVYHLYVLLSQHLARSQMERAMKATLPAGDANALQKSETGGGVLETSRLDERDYPKFVKNLEDMQRVVIQISEKMKDPALSAAQRSEMARQMMMLQLEMAKTYRLLGIYHGMRENYEEADRDLAMSFRIQPRDPATLLEIGRLLKMRSRSAEALPVLKAAVALAPQEPLIVLELGRIYADVGDKESARKVFEMVAAFGVRNPWLYVELGNWFYDNGYLQDAEKSLLAAYQINSQDHVMIARLAELELRLGKNDKAALLRKEAEFLREKMSRYAPETVRNYNEIVRRVKAAGARMVVMQYPVRDITTLRAIFERPQDIVFVENRQNFVKALKEGSFTKYFADNFAGDFGHCTSAGNRLIAENLANEMIEQIFSGKR